MTYKTLYHHISKSFRKKAEKGILEVQIFLYNVRNTQWHMQIGLGGFVKLSDVHIEQLCRTCPRLVHVGVGGIPSLTGMCDDVISRQRPVCDVVW